MLVVDDDEDHALVLEMSLTGLGFDVRTAFSCRGARDALAAERVDALVTDLWLGDGTAVDLLRSTREPRPRATVLLTGYDDASAEATLGGFDAYLVKPASAERIAAAVRERLAKPKSGMLAKVVPPRTTAGRGAA